MPATSPVTAPDPSMRSLADLTSNAISNFQQCTGYNSRNGECSFSHALEKLVHWADTTSGEREPNWITEKGAALLTASHAHGCHQGQGPGGAIPQLSLMPISLPRLISNIVESGVGSDQAFGQVSDRHDVHSLVGDRLSALGSELGSLGAKIYTRVMSHAASVTPSRAAASALMSRDAAPSV